MRPPMTNRQHPSATDQRSSAATSKHRSQSLDSDRRPPAISSSRRSFPPVDDLDSIPMDDTSFDQMDYQEEWERLRSWASTCVVMHAAYAAVLISFFCCFNNVGKSISEDASYKRHELMERLTTMDDKDCRNQLRMGKDAFGTLVRMLRGTGYLKDSVRSNLEEQVAKFLSIIGHNKTNYTIKFDFRRSGETVSRHFHQVLKAIISLHDVFLRQPNGLECP